MQVGSFFSVNFIHREVRYGAGTVLVTGSTYAVGDAMSRLPGFAPLG